MRLVEKENASVDLAQTLVTWASKRGLQLRPKIQGRYSNRLIEFAIDEWPPTMASGKYRTQENLLRGDLIVLSLYVIQSK